MDYAITMYFALTIFFIGLLISILSSNFSVAPRTKVQLFFWKVGLCFGIVASYHFIVGLNMYLDTL